MTALAAAPSLSKSMPKLRITKRGRAVLTFLIAAPLVIAAALGVINGGAAAAGNHAEAPLQYVTVQGGETLWQLAEQVAPNADPREVVSDISHLNGLTSTNIQAGQRLAIPAQYDKAIPAQ